MRRILRLAVVLVAALATPSPVEAQGRPLDGLDEWISRGLKDWSTPGLTLAVVHRDSVLLAKGYGVREFGRSEPVDENTLFSIGSCSKAFTSATIAGLVGDGRVGWEDRAIDHLPWFRLWDPWVTEHVTVRDLMAHRVGADLTIENPIWPFATSMKDLVLRGGRQQPASGFRERYHYSNNMFVAAGLVAEAASGLPFARALQDRILVPLGMSSTRLSIQDALATPNRASPHEMAGGRPVPVRWDRWPDSVLAPTGGVSSTARDMARWLRFQLGRGAIDGRRVVDSAAFDQMHIPHTPVRGGPVEAAYWFAHVDAADLQTRHWAYGLAWFVTDYRNQALVWHGGTINGFRCAMAILPELNVGMYVGVNRMTLFPPAVMLTILDRLIGGQGRDWNAVFLREAQLQADDAAKAAEARRAGRATGTRPALPLDQYQGRYDNPAVGTMVITSDSGRLNARVGTVKGILSHWHHETFELSWVNGARTLLTFRLDSQGRPSGARVENLGEFIASR
jgi:CubicO group peptidase (beta-lactamase class C family)